MRKKKSLPVKVSDATVVPWERVAPKAVFPLGRGSRAGVVVDRAGVPRVFVFDTGALLDVLSTIDERLVDRLSDAEYHAKDANPAGWLIDELETTLPVSEAYVQSLKEAIAEAQRKGWVPFEDIERALNRTLPRVTLPSFDYKRSGPPRSHDQHHRHGGPHHPAGRPPPRHHRH